MDNDDKALVILGIGVLIIASIFVSEFYTTHVHYDEVCHNHTYQYSMWFGSHKSDRGETIICCNDQKRYYTDSYGENSSYVFTYCDII